MKRTLILSALTLGLILAGCGQVQPPAGQPGDLTPPPTGETTSSASSTARSSDAKPLGMTQQELRTEISAGKSIKDILKSRGIKVPVTE